MNQQDAPFQIPNQSRVPTYMFEIPAMPPRQRRPERYLVFVGFLIVVQAVFAVVLSIGVVYALNANHCSDSINPSSCRDGTDIGTAIGAGILVAYWIGVDLLILVARIVVLMHRRNIERG